MASLSFDRQSDINVVIATINLFTEVHQWNRHNLPGYFEVYLRVPIEELRRDSKNIYSRFEAGKLSHVVGLDLPFDEPKLADWTIEYNWRPTKENAQKLLEALSRKLRMTENLDADFTALALDYSEIVRIIAPLF